jgi:hypothetical protein
MAKKNDYFVEMTDTFAGEANYSWARRFKIRASSLRGVAQIMARQTGLRWHLVDEYSDTARYDSESGLTCFFVDNWEEDYHSHYNHDVIN